MMATKPTLLRRLTNLEGLSRQRKVAPTFLGQLHQNPALTMKAAGMTPDPWQAELLRSNFSRALLLCTRQAGKSTVSAALAVHEAVSRPRSLVLLLSPSERQSGELAVKVFDFYDALGQPVPSRKRTELQLHLTNGSRIIALPENEKTIRGYSGARLLIVDEASRVGDSLYYSVRPMLAVSKGRLLAMTTPFGKRGWFYDAWSGKDDWHRVSITAEQCPRIDAAFLAEERAALGDRWYRQEYGCSFEDIVGAVFDSADIEAAMTEDVAPLFSGTGS